MSCPSPPAPELPAEVTPSPGPSSLSRSRFTLSEHPAAALAAMNELRLQGQLCDVTLRVRHRRDLPPTELRAHRVVLAAASPVFRAMFTAGLRERGLAEVPIEGVQPGAMEGLVEFAYTAAVAVGERCVLPLLHGALMYQVEPVVGACCAFLGRQLHPSNAIGIAALAERLGCQELLQRAREYIYMNFAEVSKQEEFLSLSHCQLAALLSRDELNVRCESEVFQACVAWVQQDRAARAPFLPALLRAVRCHALTPRFLRAQLRRDLGRDALRYLARVFRELALHRPTPGHPPCRTPRVRQLIYAAGGYLRRSLSTLEAFDPERGAWLRLAEMGTPRSGLGGCVVGGIFYAVGGRNNSAEGNTDSAAVECYNPVSGRWAPCAAMSVPRNRIGLGVIDGLIYAVGGSHGCTHHCSVERGLCPRELPVRHGGLRWHPAAQQHRALPGRHRDLELRGTHGAPAERPGGDGLQGQDLRPGGLRWPLLPGLHGVLRPRGRRLDRGDAADAVGAQRAGRGRHHGALPRPGAPPRGRGAPPGRALLTPAPPGGAWGRVGGQLWVQPKFRNFPPKKPLPNPSPHRRHGGGHQDPPPKNKGHRTFPSPSSRSSLGVLLIPKHRGN
ncbi:kelch-like ECH-associated protein 1 isoform X3 [Agelaius phoeniceus]